MRDLTAGRVPCQGSASTNRLTADPVQPGGSAVAFSEGGERVVAAVIGGAQRPLANKGSFTDTQEPDHPSDMQEWDHADPDRAEMQARRWMSYRGLRAARQLLRGHRDVHLRAEGLEPAELEGRQRGDHQMARCRWVRWSEGGYHVTYSPARRRGNVKGWVTCKSWLCPVCGAILAQERSTELGQAVAFARSQGCVVALGRFSDRHHVGDEQTVDELAGVLRGQVADLRTAYRVMKESRDWRRVVERFGVEGPGRGGKVRRRIYSVGALECTYGYNGYHPHEQPVFFLASGADVAVFQWEMRNLWYTARGGAWVVDPVTGEKLPADPDRWEHGCSVSSNDGEVNEYITKMGRPPRWDVAQEVVYWARKRGRGGKSKHYTMMELLWSYILAGRQDHGRLWTAFVLAMKGRHHLDWADGLRAWAGLGAARSDDEVIDEASDDLEDLALVDDLTMFLVLKQERRADLLAVADTGEAEQVREFLGGLRQAAASDHRDRGVRPARLAPSRARLPAEVCDG